MFAASLAPCVVARQLSVRVPPVAAAGHQWPSGRARVCRGVGHTAPSLLAGVAAWLAYSQPVVPVVGM